MTLNLHCAVSGNGPDLVLLHPVGLDHTFWESLAAAASRDHRVLRVDLRGHGRSPAAERGTSVEDYADDVHAAIGQHCRGAATVLGLSFGGMLAQVLALRHSNAVAALVLCGCTGGVVVLGGTELDGTTYGTCGVLVTCPLTASSIRMPL